MIITDWTEVCRSGGCDACADSDPNGEVIWVALGKKQSFKLCATCAKKLIQQLKERGIK